MADTRWFQSLELQLAGGAALVLGIVVWAAGPFAVPLSVLGVASAWCFARRLTRRQKARERSLHEAHDAQLMRERLERSRRLVREVEARFLPDANQQMGALRVQSHIREADESAGDWWGVWRLSPSRALVVVADVLARGPAAALTVCTLHTWFSIQCSREGHRFAFAFPAEILSDLNAFLWQHGRGGDLVAAQLLVVDVRTGEVVSSSAGYPCPIHFQLGEGEQWQAGILAGCGPLLGQCQVAGFRNESLSLEPGDRLLVYSNGLVNAVSGQSQSVSRRRLRQFCTRELERDPDGLQERLAAALKAFLGKVPQDDTAQFVLISFDPGAES